MTFKRIDEDTIRCIISTEEMSEYGISVEDFFKDKEKVSGFLETILKEASEEVGELQHHGVMSMQIMPLSNDRLSITFSEKSLEGSVSEMLDYLKNSLKELDDVQSGILAEKLAGIPGSREASEKEGYEKEPSRNVAQENPVRIFLFDEMEQAGRFCKNIQTEQIISRLYRENGYFLVLENPGVEKKYFDAVCELAMEYADAGPVHILETYLTEHGVCMIPNEAVQKLGALY